MELPKNITDLQNGLINKQFSCVEMLEHYLTRIKTFDPELNSFITVSSETAYKQAKENDTRLKEYVDANNSGELLKEYPLSGVVMAVKDLYLTRGIRTTAGSKLLENYVPVYSATVVKKLEKAGAIIIGKTNLDAWGHGASGENSDFGPSKNPWNKEYVPGGSSSGSAVAVSADFCTAAMGTDTGGSVRLPASFTNLVGLKPTYGAVSRYGVIAMASSLDSMGQLTHTVGDSRKIFEVTKGEDGLDSTVVNFKNNQNSKLKIGIPKEYFIKGLESQVEKKILEVIEVYKKLGVEFKEVSLANTKYGVSVYYIIQPAEVSSNLSRYDGVRYGKSRNSFGDEAKRRIMLGSYVLSAGYYDAYYSQAMKVRSLIREDFDKVFNEVDLLIAPVYPTSAFKLGEKASDPLKMYLSDILTVNANLAGIPSLAIPAGFDNNNLPIGFGLMGPRFSENLLFEMGELYQKHTTHHLQNPKL